MDEQSKDLVQSKTTYGTLIIMLAPIIGPLIGAEINTEQATEFVTALQTVIGACVFVWGQVSRSKKIGSVLGIKIGK